MAWWTVQHVALASLLCLIVHAIVRVGRIGPVGRHALWVVVLVKLLMPPMLVWPWAIAEPARITAWVVSSMRGMPALGSAAHPAAVPPVVASTPVLVPVASRVDRERPALSSPVTASASPQSSRLPGGPDSARDGGVPLLPETRPLTWLPYLAVMWLAGSIAMALLHAYRMWRMERLVGGAMPADRQVIARVATLGRQLRLRDVDVRSVAGFDSPLVWSVLRPRLLWPAGLGAGTAGMDGLIVHELAHLKRRDHWIGWLELAASIAWWWNPLFWYVRHQVRENAELACDAWVVDALPGGRRSYAEALLAVCDSLSRRSAPVLAVRADTGGRRFLERRLTVIMRDRVPLRLPRLGCVCLVLLTAASVPTIAQKAAAPVQADRPKAAGSPPAVERPVRAPVVPATPAAVRYRPRRCRMRPRWPSGLLDSKPRCFGKRR